MSRIKCFICLRKKIIIARFTNWPKKWRGVAIGSRKAYSMYMASSNLPSLEAHPVFI